MINLTAGEVHDRMAVVYEFAQATDDGGSLKEHGRLVMEQTAIELARHYSLNGNGTEPNCY